MTTETKEQQSVYLTQDTFSQKPFPPGDIRSLVGSEREGVKGPHKSDAGKYFTQRCNVSAHLVNLHTNLLQPVLLGKALKKPLNP